MIGGDEGKKRNTRRGRLERFCLAAAFAVLAWPSSTLADQRELYVLAGVGPSIRRLDDPVNGRSHIISAAPEFQLSSFYGLNNTLHLGGAVRVAFSSGEVFPNIAAPLPDGSRPEGTLYEDTVGISIGALVRYRLDTGYRVAPIAELEFGATYLSYSNIQHNPAGTSIATDFPSAAELVLGARVSVGVEYRFWDRFLAGVGVAFRLNINSLNVWQFEIPVTLGVIW